MALPRTFLHTILFLQSVFLYWAVLRLRDTAARCRKEAENSGNGKSPSAVGENVAPLYIVTPTYTRPTQLADLTRLANTLRLVSGVHWLVSEDRNSTTKAVTELLHASGLQYTQLAAARPQELVGKVIGRGVFNRSPFSSPPCY